MTALLAGAALLVLALATAGGRRTGRSAPSRRFTRADVVAAIDLATRAHPILPRWFVWAMADKESGLNPRGRHVDQHERSHGLFQINWNAHGTVLTRRGVSLEQLYDPMVNAAYWSELADGLWREAVSRGYRDDAIAYAVRLRLKGVPWQTFAGVSPLAYLRSIEQAPRFESFVAKWKARMGNA